MHAQAEKTQPSAPARDPGHICVLCLVDRSSPNTADPLHSTIRSRTPARLAARDARELRVVGPPRELVDGRRGRDLGAHDRDGEVRHVGGRDGRAVELHVATLLATRGAR